MKTFFFFFFFTFEYDIYSPNTEFGIHSQGFSLSNIAHHSYDEIAFIPDTNNCERLSFSIVRCSRWLLLKKL